MQSHKFRTLLIAVLTLVALTLTLASPAWAVEYKLLHKFIYSSGDGWYPYSDLIFDTAGNLYGTTFYGGRMGTGAVFKLAPDPDGSWNYTVIYFFDQDPDAHYPYSGVTFDASGNLYGTTISGGPYPFLGTVFSLTPNPDGTWSESIIYKFRGPNGRNPRAGLTLDASGNFYGTTSGGGAYDYGTVFKLAPNPDGTWTRTKLHAFKGPDGATPYGGLILDAAGNLYGTTSGGGAYDYGTVFKLAPNPNGTWTRTKLHTFKGPDGATPYGGLILDTTGNLYGTTSAGGAYDYGTVFKLSPNPDGTWARTKLHTFTGPDGATPYGHLILDTAGNLYGTTSAGGAYDYGTVFKLAPNPDGTWTRTMLHAFEGPDGAYPYAGLIFDAAGSLYGTTSSGGTVACENYSYGCGVVFQIKP